MENVQEARALLGHHDKHVRLLRDAFSVRIVMRGTTLSIEGGKESVGRVSRLVNDLRHHYREQGALYAATVGNAVRSAQERVAPGESRVSVLVPGLTITPRTDGQKRYLQAMRENDLVFCVGPAGTGKTYLAVAMAVEEFKEERVRKIVLARPAVEAGEKLGFLPGDSQAKVNPYLRPLYDALQDMMGFPQLRKYMEKDLVEVVPLAYMRGRNLEKSFIILDEAQNCTTGQMKMFLTRLGVRSRSVVTGDISQIDLPSSQASGLVEGMRILCDIEGLSVVRLTQHDIVRHRLVQDIVDAYDAHEQRGVRASKDNGPVHGVASEKE